MDQCTATTTVPGHPGRLARCSLGVGHEGKHTKGDIIWDQKSPIADDRGWWFPIQYSARGRAHWATSDGRSLCLRWMTLGTPDEAFDTDPMPVGDGSSECKECRRRLDRRRGVPA